MKVEYLIVSPQDGNFCNSELTFNNLLQISDEIKISGNKLTFTDSKKSLKLDYRVETEIIKDKDQRYFHVTFISDNTEKIDLFTNFLRLFRKTIKKLHTEVVISVIWDDISIYYITEAYPLINEIENLMRYVILKFMIINVGMDWTQTAMPSDLRGKIDNKSNRNNSENTLENYLYNADFSQLSDFLFSNYREIDLNQLDNILRSNESSKELTIEKIKEKVLPKSNWSRYFSDLIKYESKKLTEEWKQLNLLRIKVAHNKDFTKLDLDNVIKLTNKIRGKLKEAINSLTVIKLDNQQKQLIINNSLVTSIRNAEIIDLENFGIDRYLRVYNPFINHLERSIDTYQSGIDVTVMFKAGYQVGLKTIAITQQQLSGLYNRTTVQYVSDNIMNIIRLKTLELAFSIEQYDEVHILVILQMQTPSMYDIQAAIKGYEISIKNEFPNLRIFSTTTGGSGMSQDEAFINELSSLQKPKPDNYVAHNDNNAPN